MKLGCPCLFCNKETVGTLRKAPKEMAGEVFQGILQVFCDVCGNVCGYPHQSSLKMLAMRKIRFIINAGCGYVLSKKDKNLFNDRIVDELLLAKVKKEDLPLFVNYLWSYAFKPHFLELLRKM